MSAPAPYAAYCLEYAKDGPARFLAHLDMQEQIERTLRRARLPLAFTEGFHPRPRLQYEDPLPLGWSSECERVWVDLERPYPSAEALRRLTASAPAGVRFLRVYPVLRAQPPARRRYRVAGLSLPAGAPAALTAAFPPGAVQLERAPGDAWVFRLAPAAERPAPSLKKVLQCALGGELPAGVEVVRLAEAEP